MRYFTTPIPFDDGAPIAPSEPRLPDFPKRRYLLHLFLFWLLLSVVDIGLERQTDYGLQRVERLWRGSNIVTAFQATGTVGPSEAPFLNLSDEQFATGQATVENYLNRLELLDASYWNRAISINVGRFTFFIGAEVLFNMIPAFFFAMMCYLRDRQSVAERFIEQQNRVYQQLNFILNQRVRHSQDIIERLHRMKNQLVEAEKLASIGRLSATLAHEIRNPLTIIKSSLDIIADEVQTTSGSGQALELMRDEINRMDRIISDLLNFSRPKPPRVEHHDLQSLVRHWLPPIVEELERDHIQLVPQLDEPGLVAIDADQFYQVFLNLMWNARDALKGGPRGHIFVRTEDGGENFLKLVVQDTGPGMIPDVLMQVTEPFYTTKTQGTGLGLPVSIQLMEAMNGELDIESELEVGTTVTLFVPRAGSKYDRISSNRIDIPEMGDLEPTPLEKEG